MDKELVETGYSTLLIIMVANNLRVYGCVPITAATSKTFVSAKEVRCEEHEPLCLPKAKLWQTLHNRPPPHEQCKSPECSRDTIYLPRNLPLSTVGLLYVYGRYG